MTRSHRIGHLPSCSHLKDAATTPRAYCTPVTVLHPKQIPTSGPLHQLFLPLWMFEIFAQTLAKSCIHSFSDENWVTESKVASEPCTGFRHRGCEVHCIKYSFIGYCLVSKLCPTLLWPPRTVAPRLLCPWDFPGKNSGGGCYFLLQGIFPTQELKPCLLHLADSFPMSHQGSPHRGMDSPNIS